MKTIVKIATRSRPDQAIQTISKFLSRAHNPRNLKIIVSVDDDDPTSAKLISANQLPSVVRVVRGQSTCKVAAINRDLAGEMGDVLIVAADDQVPAPGYDTLIERCFQQFFPNFDGAIHFDDGHTGRKLNTIPVMGWNLYRKFDYVYHPEYTSLWCDNEYTELLSAMGRLVYRPEIAIRHNHPSFTGKPADALLARNESFYNQDKVVFDRRRAIVRPASRWAFDSPDVILSILIPSLVTRKGSREILLRELNRQINNNPERRRIEVWLDIDGGGLPVGVKRNNLLHKANGRFVCFVDDDDMVSPSYIDDIVAAILADLEADCIGLEGTMTENGTNPRRFIHSITCGGYYEKDGVFYRTPNHLNPVRADHARAAGFPAKNCGEDTEYAQRLQANGSLRKETMIPRQIYQYRFDRNKTATQRRLTRHG